MKLINCIVWGIILSFIVNCHLNVAYAKIHNNPTYHIKILVLTQNKNKLDKQERAVVSFLHENGYSYILIDPTNMAQYLSKPQIYKLLLFRTGSRPIIFKDKIKLFRAYLKNGGTIWTEYYGRYLLDYLNEIKVVPGAWGPVAHDSWYFVKAIDNSPIFNNIPTWDPPERPDKKKQLMGRLIHTGFYRCVNITENLLNDPTWKKVKAWALTTTYGWWGERTNTDYCSEWGKCTGERAVHQWRIYYKNVGKGKLLLGAHFSDKNGACEDSWEIGFAGKQIFKNIVKWVFNKTKKNNNYKVNPFISPPRVSVPEKIIVSGERYTITWTPVYGATKYEIKEIISENNTTDNTTNYTTSTKKQFFHIVKDYKTISYKIRAFIGNEITKWSNPQSVTIDPSTWAYNQIFLAQMPQTTLFETENDNYIRIFYPWYINNKYLYAITDYDNPNNVITDYDNPYNPLNVNVINLSLAGLVEFSNMTTPTLAINTQREEVYKEIFERLIRQDKIEVPYPTMLPNLGNDLLVNGSILLGSLSELAENTKLKSISKFSEELASILTAAGDTLTTFKATSARFILLIETKNALEEERIKIIDNLLNNKNFKDPYIQDEAVQKGFQEAKQEVKSTINSFNSLLLNIISKQKDNIIQTGIDILSSLAEILENNPKVAEELADILGPDAGNLIEILRSNSEPISAISVAVATYMIVKESVLGAWDHLQYVILETNLMLTRIGGFSPTTLSIETSDNSLRKLNCFIKNSYVIPDINLDSKDITSLIKAELKYYLAAMFCADTEYLLNGETLSQKIAAFLIKFLLNPAFQQKAKDIYYVLYGGTTSNNIKIQKGLLDILQEYDKSINKLLNSKSVKIKLPNPTPYKLPNPTPYKLPNPTPYKLPNPTYYNHTYSPTNNQLCTPPTLPLPVTRTDLR